MKNQVTLITMLLIILLGGYAIFTLMQPEPAKDLEKDTQELQEDTKIQATLFFPDRIAQHVIPEERDIQLKGKTQEEAVLLELLKGPNDPYLNTAFPENLRLLSVEVKDNIAYANFSSEMKQIQGVTGAGMATESIVYTLTELPTVNKVAILTDGEPWYLQGYEEKPQEPRPISRHIKDYPIYIDDERVRWLQQKADNGEEQWRLNPLEVAQKDGRMAGFYSTDQFQQIGIEDNVALITVQGQNGKTYILELIQPVKRGPEGIWTITDVTQK